MWWMNIAVNTCGRPWLGMPRKLSCSTVFVARTATLPMVAMTSSTVHCRLIRPNVANRGPPCIIQVGVIMAMRSSMLCGVARGQVVSREDRWCRARTGGVARGQVVSREDRWCRARTGGVARGQVDLTARKLTGTHSGYGGWATSPVRDRGVVLVQSIVWSSGYSDVMVSG